MILESSSSADEVPLDLIHDFNIFMFGNSCSSVAQPPPLGPQSHACSPFGTAGGIQAHPIIQAITAARHSQQWEQRRIRMAQPFIRSLMRNQPFPILSCPHLHQLALLFVVNLV